MLPMTFAFELAELKIRNRFRVYGLGCRIILDDLGLTLHQLVPSRSVDDVESGNTAPSVFEIHLTEHQPKALTNTQTCLNPDSREAKPYP